MKVLNTGFGILGAWLLRRPFYVRFHITYRCNYRCGMCAIHDILPQFPELAIEDIRSISERLWTLGARHVVLTGGEPFLRPDLPDVVRAFAQRGFSVRIQTNGAAHVTREAIVAVRDAGARDLSVSVDSLEAPLQDDICESREVLEHALRTLELSRELLTKGMSLANIVGSPHNFDELPRLVQYFGERGIYSYITPAVVRAEDAPDDGEYLFRSSDPSFTFNAVPDGIRDDIIDALIALRRQGCGLTNSTRHLEDFREFIRTGASAWSCSAGSLALDIRPNGDVSACKEKPPLGNILSPSFHAMYRGADFRRRAADQARRCTGCFYGEYREPHYAVRDPAVLGEWVRDWLRTFRRGMAWNRGAKA